VAFRPTLTGGLALSVLIHGIKAELCLQAKSSDVREGWGIPRTSLTPLKNLLQIPPNSLL
jgi:hypothetical protein